MGIIIIKIQGVCGCVFSYRNRKKMFQCGFINQVNAKNNLIFSCNYFLVVCLCVYMVTIAPLVNTCTATHNNT